MALSDPRILFGIHQVSPYSRADGSFYGTLKVLGGSSLSLTGELIKLNGGSNKYPWAVEDGLITSEMTLKFKEYPAFLWTLFLGQAPTTAGVDAAGAVSTAANKLGTSVVSATGIASVSVIPTTGAANLKFGKYMIRRASATTLNIYVSSDIDFARGTAETYDDDALLVAVTGAITTGGNTDVASLGLRFVGGAGAIAFVAGETATFEVKPPSTSSMEVVVGGAASTFPEFGCLIYGKKRGDSSVMEIDAYRCKAVGLPIGFDENAFSEAEVKVEVFYDSAQNGVMKIRHLVES
jgi:hypothetical protein